VGHGVDHQEIAVLYEWLDKWNEVSGDLPRGGMMGWPMMAFLKFLPEFKHLYPSSSTSASDFMVAHFGAGTAEPYTDFPTVVCTPNCIKPDLSTGYRATVTSKSPFEPLRVVHHEQTSDYEALGQGVLATVRMMDDMQRKGLVGRRLEPPGEVLPIAGGNLSSATVTPAIAGSLHSWIRENHFTVFHWACTCQAGVHGRVADEQFRVRGTSGTVIPNLRVGSAACLPEMTDANPHLTISAFAFALAEAIIRNSHNGSAPRFAELSSAKQNLAAQSGRIQIRRPGQETPLLENVALDYFHSWKKLHSDKFQ
jgi:hypothetical protein